MGTNLSVVALYVQAAGLPVVVHGDATAVWMPLCIEQCGIFRLELPAAFHGKDSKIFFRDQAIIIFDPSETVDPVEADVRGAFRQPVHRRDMFSGVGITGLKGIEKEHRQDGERKKSQQNARDRPSSLGAFEMPDTFPPLVSPGPFVPFETQHDGHDQTHHGNKGQKPDPGPVADGPYEIQEKSPPVPSLYRVGRHAVFSMAGGICHF